MCKIIIFIAVILPIVTCLYEGDSCTSYNGIPGTCKFTFHCEFAINRLKSESVKPITCGFKDREPIVCCPNGITLIENYGNQNRVLVIERISHIKCKEYSNCALLSRKNRVARQVAETAVLSEYPHMVAIGWPLLGSSGYIWSCEGSLVSENFVITAAHCTFLNDSRVSRSQPTIVRLGGLNLKSIEWSNERGRIEDIAIVQIIKHPQYKPPVRYHDIALLKLAKSIVRGIFVNPLCLWADPTIRSTNATVTGWGTIDFLEGSSNNLRKATVPIINNTQCSRLYTYNIIQFPQGIVGEQICAGYPSGATYSCQGDTGGPLQIFDPQQNCAHHLIGVTSFGGGCAGEYSPPVYTRISSYIDWIETIVWS